MVNFPKKKMAIRMEWYLRCRCPYLNLCQWTLPVLDAATEVAVQVALVLTGCRRRNNPTGFFLLAKFTV